jgi:hypothetical protein
VLAEIRRLRDSGTTLRGIARELNHRALRTQHVAAREQEAIGTPRIDPAIGYLRLLVREVILAGHSLEHPGAGQAPPVPTPPAQPSTSGQCESA